MASTNLTTTNSETFNSSNLREIAIDSPEWDEPQQQVLPGLKVTGVTGRHRQLKQTLRRLLEESSFSVLLTSLRELADDRAEWCAEFGYSGQQVPSDEAEFYDLLSMSIDKAQQRALRWQLLLQCYKFAKTNAGAALKRPPKRPNLRATNHTTGVAKPANNGHLGSGVALSASCFVTL